MIWMIQDDVMTADGMVMYNLSVLHILSAPKSVCNEQFMGDSFFSDLTTFVSNMEAYM